MDIQSFFLPIAHAQEAAQSSSPVAVLGLNVQLFIAQLINFAVIIFILWKWVLTPVAKKLQERSGKIEKSLADAQRIEKEKQEFEAWRQAEMGKARREASGITTEAQAEANRIKDASVQQTKDEQSKVVEQTRKQLEQEKTQVMASARGELADMVTIATEKIIRQKLDGKKDAELIKESLKSI